MAYYSLGEEGGLMGLLNMIKQQDEAQTTTPQTSITTSPQPTSTPTTTQSLNYNTGEESGGLLSIINRNKAPAPGSTVPVASANPYYTTGVVDENGGISVAPTFPTNLQPAAKPKTPTSTTTTTTKPSAPKVSSPTPTTTTSTKPSPVVQSAPQQSVTDFNVDLSGVDVIPGQDLSNLQPGDHVYIASANPYYSTAIVQPDGSLKIPPMFPSGDNPYASGGGKTNVKTSEPGGATDMSGDVITIPKDSKGSGPPSTIAKPPGGGTYSGGGYSGGSAGGNYTPAPPPRGNAAPTIMGDQSYESVESILGRLLGGNSPYLKAARQRAMERMAARGLLNSSIAAGAGERAAIEAAFPIAAQDSQQSYGWNLSTKEFKQDYSLMQAEYDRRWSELNRTIEGNLQLQRLVNSGQMDVQRLRNQGAREIAELEQKFAHDQNGAAFMSNYTSTQNTILGNWNAELQRVQGAEGMTEEQKAAAFADINGRYNTQFEATYQTYSKAANEYDFGPLPDVGTYTNPVDSYHDTKPQPGA